MSIDLTGIQNVGEFYSHHYLDALLENDLKGLFARWREDDEATPDRRLNRCATDFFAAKSRALREPRPADRYAASHGLHVQLAEALGYAYSFELRYLQGITAVPVLSAVKRDGRDYIWLVETVFTGPDESPLDQDVLRGQYPKTEDEFAAPELPWESLVGEIFRRDEPPRWLILLAGRFIYLIDRTKWGQGQYLLFDLDEIFGRRQTQTLRATAALLAREALCPDEGVPLHDTLDENSHKHAYGVSSDLKYGVRRAVELLASEYVWYQRNVGKQALFQDDALARKLTNEALTYLYRLLFLFYAEARGGELDVVPMKSDAYRTGYSLEALRDLEQAPLTTPQAQNGYFLNESLDQLFRLVNDGFMPSQMTLLNEQAEQQTFHDYGFSLPGLHNPLFSRESTPLLSSVKFRNCVLQEVIQLLSLSRETRARKSARGARSTRGRISYAQLGINQLGAVYEGLLSYTGFFAQETLVEVKPADAKEAEKTAQTYFVPESEIARYEPDELVYVEGPDGARVRKTYPRGSFIFRLAGRDREKLASYYTPEVLTRCVVKYSLKELLRDKSADEILRLQVCEMALGSGAFVNEALNQLADAYLERKQKELGRRIPPDDYREERQKVKAYLALNNVHGVDLNPTAIELARVSIWLNIIYRGATTPWLGARFAVGNSLIGARRQVYSAEDVKSGEYRNQAPSPVALLATGEGRGGGRIFHWLLPDSGMAAFDTDKVIKELAPDQVKAIKDWRKKFTAKITAPELANLQALSDRADELWAQVVRDRQALIEHTRESVPVWGQASAQSNRAPLTIADKEADLARFNRPNGPFRRLRLAMDYWCALWFWPIPQAGQLPTRQQFLDDMAAIFAGDSGFEKPPEQLTLDAALVPAAPRQARLADVPTPSVDDLCERNPRLRLAAELAERLHFHHWELAFAEVFAERGGFDLLLGNPPWVSVAFDEGGVLSDYDPRIALRKLSATQSSKLRSEMLESLQVLHSYLDEFTEQTGAKNFLGSLANYFLLVGKSNLYKCFITRSWEIGSTQGVVGLLHPEGVYDDPNGGFLRSYIYLRLKSHFQFQNELKLFAEIAHVARYSVNVYTSSPSRQVGFDHIANLFNPSTLDQCFNHDGLGVVPGIRDDSDNWSVRGHHSRIVFINESRLGFIASLYDEPDTPSLQARLPLIHSNEIIRVLESMAVQKRKLSHLSEHYYMTPTTFWNETTAQKDGTIKRETRYPKDLQGWIASGPHFYVATPFNKNPNENCR